MNTMDEARPRPLTAGQFERITQALSSTRRIALLEEIARAPDLGSVGPDRGLSEPSRVEDGTRSPDLEQLVDAGLVTVVRKGDQVRIRGVPGVAEAYGAELVRRVGNGKGA